MAQVATWIDGNIVGDEFYNDLNEAGIKYELGRVDREDFTQEICLEENDIREFDKVLNMWE